MTSAISPPRYASRDDLIKLAFKSRSQRSAGFDLASVGEIQFLRNVLLEFAGRLPDVDIWVFHHDDTLEEFYEHFPDLAARAYHVRAQRIREWWFRRLDLYVTTEQFGTGPAGVYTLTLFHGQPAKGLTFRLPDLPGFPMRDALAINDALFLYGPLQRQTLDEHLFLRGMEMPSHLSLFEIGYSKSDDLLNGRYNGPVYLEALGLSPLQPTVLYAPAFNEGASMRECGVEIIETLCNLKGINVLAKLAIDCLRPTTDYYATGGLNWFDVIGRLEDHYPNFKLVRDTECDPALAAADIMVTCISSVGFEFLALKKPVIYMETPAYFDRYLPALFPELDTSTWTDRTAVNGGKEFGLRVSSAPDLPNAVSEVLARPEIYPKQQSRLPEYLVYNPGRAARAAVDKIEVLLAARVRSRRSRSHAQAYLDFMCDHTPLISRIRIRMRNFLISKPKAAIGRVLNALGYSLAKIDKSDGYIDAEATVAAARARGLSVCDYRESLEEPNKRGRRDRIIKRMKEAGVFSDLHRVCEIGAGTGMYLEKVLDLAKPERYEVYEVHKGWVQFLTAEYGPTPESEVICHPADGYTLSFTGDDSCDLVHAHAVFVYIPLLHIFGYLEECVRVCRTGGYIVFDCFTDIVFSSLPVVEKWKKAGFYFPVVVPKALLEVFAEKSNLTLVHSFSEIYGAGTVDYFVWHKR